jgi:hypothetical protein
MYFEQMETVADVKNRFRELMFEFHPDRHPQKEFAEWNRKAQVLNEKYQEALESLHRSEYLGTDDKVHTYYYNAEVEQMMASIIEQLVKANLSKHIAVEIVGTWVWVSGTRYEDTEDRAKLNNIEGMRWHGKRKKWYWKPPKSRRRGYSGMSFEAMKNMYGSRRVDVSQEEEEEKQAAIAA